MPEAMPHEPTYTNFHMLRGHREDETIYNNCDVHRENSRRARGFQGCGREISCGEWTIILGKSCFLFVVLGISFLVMFVLLLACISKISMLPDGVDKMEEKIMSALHKIQNNSAVSDEVKQMAEEMMSELNKIQNNISMLLDRVKQKEKKIMSELENIQKQSIFIGQCPEKWSLRNGVCFHFVLNLSDLNKTEKFNNGTQWAEAHFEIQHELPSVNNTATQERL
ncbi:uncharacterized protein LOC125447558 isoform X2 [Stegostoma tigrinum]|uniref:uncharacterized protein LOC125447558 isoform X2 n=1 Tax=Stegostoma tigrinum TaxID=3053191 RepID=UPI0028707749|nr:uncharacterized protein LOC125447558 isoform X2 [Stegostoma tigrinum]